MFTSISFYQGGWETDETVEEAACREALEEAGVRGVIQVLCFSFYSYELFPS